MYINDLEIIRVGIDEIYLDPNNPRFWVDASSKITPDTKIPDDKVQIRTTEAMQEFGIDDLYSNILRNGFLPLDRIVVREIRGHTGKYVVVEGNRRLTALKKLRKNIEDDLVDEEGIDEAQLEKIKEHTDTLEVLLYKGGELQDISWLLQGIRHISGIRNWGPAQQARLVVDRVDNHGMSFTEAGQQFGIGPQKVGRLYRVFKALEQMKADDEFQTKAKNEYFTLFEEVIRDKKVRDWLGWDPDQDKFTNTDHLRMFYAWISPDDEAPEGVENKRRIHDPRQIKKLSDIVDDEHKNILNKFDQWELTIEQAQDKAIKKPSSFDWREALEEIEEILGSIPQISIQENAKEFMEKLYKISKQIESSIKMAKAVDVFGEDQCPKI